MSETKVEILNLALKLLQSQGYNGTSFAQIAQQLGLKTSGIHYYFPYKEDLATEVVANYRDSFAQKLEQIDQKSNQTAAKVQDYCSLYEAVLAPQEEQKICLCAVLAAEFPTLPPKVQEQVRGFFTDNQGWLAQILGSEDKANLLIAALEGSLLLARTQKGKAQFRQMSQQLIQLIELHQS